MNGIILDVESSSVRLILISVVPFCFSFLMRSFNSSYCAEDVLLATIKDSVETLSEFPATTPFFWVKTVGIFDSLANHRSSCRTSGVIRLKSEKLRYRTDRLVGLGRNGGQTRCHWALTVHRFGHLKVSFTEL